MFINVFGLSSQSLLRLYFLMHKNQQIIAVYCTVLYHSVNRTCVILKCILFSDKIL